jgi:hypothetical protein
LIGYPAQPQVRALMTYSEVGTWNDLRPEAAT